MALGGVRNGKKSRYLEQLLVPDDLNQKLWKVHRVDLAKALQSFL